MKKIITLFILVSAFSVQSIAQKVSEGYVKYEVTEIKADSEEADPQFEMVKGMLQGTSTKVFFTKKQTLTKINTMGGMSSTKLLTDEAGNSEMYIDMMGQKMFIKMTKEEVEKANKENETAKPEYIHHNDKTKEILGYKAHLVEAKVPKEGGKMQFWVTKEIEAQGQIQQGIDNQEIGGFPLEIKITIPGQFSMTTTATDFKKDVDKSVFDFDKKGYKEMTMEELQKMGMGGM